MSIYDSCDFSLFTHDIKELVVGPHSYLHSSIPSQSGELQGYLLDTSERMMDALHQIFPSLVAGYCEREIISSASPLLTGRICHLEMPAKGVKKIYELFQSFRGKINRLPSGEKAVLLKHLPPALSAMLEQDWPSSRILGLSVGFSSLIADTSEIFKLMGGGLLTLAGHIIKPIVKGTADRLLDPDVQLIISKGLKDVGEEFLKDLFRFSKDATKESIQWILPHVYRTLVRGSTVGADQVVTWFTQDFKFVEEILNKLDRVAAALPPNKLLSILMFALKDFSEANQEAKIRTEPLSVIEKLRMLALENRLPVQEMNGAFSALLGEEITDASGLAKLCLDLFKKGVGEAKLEEEFEALYAKEPKMQRPLLKAAVCVKILSEKSAGKELAGVAFLAELVLLNTNASDEEIFQPASLLEGANLIYLKKYFYQTIVTTLLPEHFNELLSGLNRLTGVHLEDLLSNQLAETIFKKGLAMLTDKHGVSTLLLNLLGADTARFSEYKEEVGTWDTQYLQVCQNLGKPGYFPALQAATPKLREKSKAALGEEASEELKTVIWKQADALSLFKRLYMGSAVRSLAVDLSQISDRQDWGLFILFFLGRLNKALQKPEQVQELNLLDKRTLNDCQQAVKVLIPSMAWVIPYISELAHQYVEGVSYASYTDRIKCKLMFEKLNNLVVKRLKFNSETPYPPAADEPRMLRALHEALKVHVEDAVKRFWQIEPSSPKGAYASQVYIGFLLQLPEGELFPAIQLSPTEPKKILQQLIGYQQYILNQGVQIIDTIVHSSIGNFSPSAVKKEKERMGRKIAELEKLGEGISSESQTDLVLFKKKIVALQEISKLPRLFYQLKLNSHQLELLYQTENDVSTRRLLDKLQVKLNGLEINLKKIEDDILLKKQSLSFRDKVIVRLEDEKKELLLIIEDTRLKISSLSQKEEELLRTVTPIVDQMYEEFEAGELVGRLAVKRQVLVHYLSQKIHLETKSLEQMQFEFEDLAQSVEKQIQTNIDVERSLYRQIGKVPAAIHHRIALIGRIVQQQKDSASEVKGGEILYQKGNLRALKYGYGVGLWSDVKELFVENQEMGKGLRELERLKRDSVSKLNEEAKERSQYLSLAKLKIEELFQNKKEIIQQVIITKMSLTYLESLKEEKVCVEMSENNKSRLLEIKNELIEKNSKIDQYIQSKIGGSRIPHRVFYEVKQLMFDDPVLIGMQDELNNLAYNFERQLFRNKLSQHKLDSINSLKEKLRREFRTDDLAELQEILEEKGKREKETLETIENELAFNQLSVVRLQAEIDAFPSKIDVLEERAGAQIKYLRKMLEENIDKASCLQLFNLNF